MSVKQKLEDEFESQMNLLSNMDVGTDEYVKTVEGVSKIADRLIKIQQLNDEYDLKRIEIENAKENHIQEEEQARKKNRIDWAKVIVPTVGAFTMGIITMIWEKTDTLTTSAGKSALRDILPFKVK